MSKFATNVYGVFHGIYFWGQGFKDTETRVKWDEFWNNLSRRTYWRFCPPKDSYGGSCGNLVSIQNTIYMHPMDFAVTLVSPGYCRMCVDGGDNKKYFTHFSGEVRELLEICNECAEKCGGTFELFASEEYVIDEDRHPTINIITSEEEYNSKCKTLVP